MNIKPLTLFIIAVVFVGLIGAAYYVGSRYRPAPVEIDLTVVDSLEKANTILQDSIKLLESDRKEIIRYKTVYRTAVDSVKLHTNKDSITTTLNYIMNYNLNN